MTRIFIPSATATILTILLPLALFSGPHAIAAEPEPDSMNPVSMNPDNMNDKTAERFARLALEGIVSALTDDDPRRDALLAAARQHADVGLAGVSGAYYEGRHRLASFAVYLETRRGIAQAE